MFFGVPVGIVEGIAVLDQEPFVLGAGSAVFDADQNEAAAEFFAEELELEVAFGQAFVDAHVAFGRVRAFVPDDHFAAAVFAFGDGAFEFAVVVGVIFDLHCQAFVGGIHRRTFGDRPGFQDAIEFEAQIVVEAGGGVFLDDEDAGGMRREPGLPALWFW